MDIKEVQNLIKFVAKSGVSEVKIENKDFKLTIKNKAEYVTAAPVAVQATQPVAAIPAAPAAAPAPVETQQNTQEADNSNYITIKAPPV